MHMLTSIVFVFLLVAVVPPVHAQSSHAAPISALEAAVQEPLHALRADAAMFLAVSPDGRTATIPLHGGREIGPPLFYKIVRQLGISVEEFQKLR